MKFYTFFCMCLSFASSVSLPFVDLPKYTGRWFQVYANPLSYYLTETAGSCIVADYGIVSPSSISIRNSEVLNGKPKSIQAIATVVDPSEPGKLTVKFDGVPVNGTYWIYDVGPVENDQYQYSIVSDNLRQSLFVLTRNLESYKSSYEPKLMETLSTLGFNPKNLIPTPQTNCTYN